MLLLLFLPSLLGTSLAQVVLSLWVCRVLIMISPVPRQFPAARSPLLRLCPYSARQPKIKVTDPKKTPRHVFHPFVSFSLFDHANNIFGGSPSQFDGQNTCITFDAVNTAFASARERVRLRPVRGEFEIEDVGNLGTVIHETSR